MKAKLHDGYGRFIGTVNADDHAPYLLVVESVEKRYQRRYFIRSNYATDVYDEILPEAVQPCVLWEADYDRLKSWEPLPLTVLVF